MELSARKCISKHVTAELGKNTLTLTLVKLVMNKVFKTTFLKDMNSSQTVRIWGISYLLYQVSKHYFH